MSEQVLSQRQRRRSDSRATEQVKAELLMRSLLSAQIGCVLGSKRRVSLTNRKEIEVDAYCKEPKVLVEIYAHIGELKSAQKHKIANDLLKFAAVRHTPGFWQHSRLIFACASRQVQRGIRDCWLAAASELFEVEIILLDIGKNAEFTLRMAQQRQDHTQANVLII